MATELNSAPVSGADVPNGTDIHDVCWAVMEELREWHYKLPKHIRKRLQDADGNTCAEIAERILAKRYPPEATE